MAIWLRSLASSGLSPYQHGKDCAMEGMTFITLKSWVFSVEGGSELIVVVAFCTETGGPKEGQIGRTGNYSMNCLCYVNCFKK
jgi:hypothetical protein